jgi:predicted nucleotidyltransferase
MGETPLASAILRELGTGAFPGIASAYLFGSEAAGRAHAESDVDLGVLLRRDLYPTDRDRFEMRLRLGSGLGVALGGRTMDIVVLNDAPPTLARAIVIEGRRILCADAVADHAFVRDAQLRAADLEPFLQRMRRIKLQAIARP